TQPCMVTQIRGFDGEFMRNVLTRIAPLLLAFAPVLAGCGESGQKQVAPPAPAVTVEKPQKQTVVDNDRYVGRFIAVDSVGLRAPGTGRIGDRRVSECNLVTCGTRGNTTLLATIVSIDPIRFEFTFDEASFLRYERLSKEGKDIASRGGGLEVAVRLIDENA